MPPVSRDVVLLVLGAGFMLLGLIGNIKIREISLQVSNVIRCILAVTGVALLATGIFVDNLFPARAPASGGTVNPPNTSPPQSPPVSGTPPAVLGIVITQPADNDMVAGEGDVSGSYDPSISDDIWVIVWPEKAPGKGWPQTDDGKQGLPCAKRDGKWTVHCFFGGPPQRYRIAVYTATPAASNIISTELRSWYMKNDYMGITRANLPQGLKEQGEIKVRKGT
jgi:hypothetical protein